MEAQYFIRDYFPGDYGRVEKLWRDTGMADSHRGDTEEVIARTFHFGGRLLVLEERPSGRIIGTSWLTQDGRRLYLHHFGIAPEDQGRGHAKQLLRQTLHICKEIGMQVKLEVHGSNKRAIALYCNAGFSRLGDYDVYIIRDLSAIEKIKKQD